MFVFVPAVTLQTRRISSFAPQFSRCSLTAVVRTSPPRLSASVPIATVTRDLKDSSHTLTPDEPARTSTPSYIAALQPGAAVEIWSSSQIHFGVIRSTYDKGVVVDLATGSAGKVSTTVGVKKSFDEIVSVWPAQTSARKPYALRQLVTGVELALTLLRNSAPRTLDLTAVHARLSRAPKQTSSAPLSSAGIAQLIFPDAFRQQPTDSLSRDRHVTATIASAILVASDPIRFKRAGPGAGWRVLPLSVTVARQRTAFVDKCKEILEGKPKSNLDLVPQWTREQLDILREIQIVAASGTAASGTAATALRILGYEENDNGATRLLLDIQYWARGNPASETVREFKRDEVPEESGTSPVSKDTFEIPRSQAKLRNTVRDWAFPPEILDEAREVRKAARNKRASLRESSQIGKGDHRRNLQVAKNGRVAGVYCIDDKKSRFLDDAFSVTTLDDEGVVRVSVHIADVDEVVTSGSTIDTMARDRGQSLYLPLKPLHMLPAAVMEAASFDTSMSTEAITISVDIDMNREKVRNWEVFASVVPPVTRVDYNQFDITLENGTTSQTSLDDQSRDLLLIAKAAPILSAKLDERKSTRRRRRRSDFSERFSDAHGNGGSEEANGIAAVRLVKSNTSSSKGERVAEVVDFRTTGSHTAVDDILMSAGVLLRKFAKENNAHLPEGQDASSYVARCGTAPLRRYLDLAIQRQIKCVLFGRLPAGRRRMRELRVWLAKRHSAGERTVAEKRKSALFDSFSNHCARQRIAAGLEQAEVRGRVLNASVSRTGKIRFVVNLDGTGLSTTAGVSPELLKKIQPAPSPQGPAAASKDSAAARNETLERAKKVVPFHSRVKLAVQDVDLSAQRIQALITDVL